MPRIHRTKKVIEKLLIREFVRFLGFRIIRSLWPDRPDAILTLCKGKQKKKVAIEITEYFHDTLAGQESPVSPIADFWKHVESSLVHRISHRRHLSGIIVNVKLKENQFPPGKYSPELAKKLAKEIVDFLKINPVRISQHPKFSIHDFYEYPTLKSLCSSLGLTRETEDAVPVSRGRLNCSNTTTGNIGLNLNNIKSSIKTKNKKAKTYIWHNAEEKWLLIAASGSTPSNRAGSPTLNLKWKDTDLMNLCRLPSPFDKIVFWESISRWCKWLR